MWSPVSESTLHGRRARRGPHLYCGVWIALSGLHPLHYGRVQVQHSLHQICLVLNYEFKKKKGMAFEKKAWCLQRGHSCDTLDCCKFYY